MPPYSSPLSIAKWPSLSIAEATAQTLKIRKLSLSACKYGREQPSCSRPHQNNPDVPYHSSESASSSVSSSQSVSSVSESCSFSVSSSPDNRLLTIVWNSSFRLSG